MIEFLKNLHNFCDLILTNIYYFHSHTKILKALNFVDSSYKESWGCILHRQIFINWWLRFILSFFFFFSLLPLLSPSPLSFHFLTATIMDHHALLPEKFSAVVFHYFLSFLHFPFFSRQHTICIFTVAPSFLISDISANVLWRNEWIPYLLNLKN